jgi:hypothetical protein
VANTLVWATLLVTAIGIIGAPVFIYLIATGLEAGAFDAAVWMTRLMFPYISFMAFVALAAAQYLARVQDSGLHAGAAEYVLHRRLAVPATASGTADLRHGHCRVRGRRAAGGHPDPALDQDRHAARCRGTRPPSAILACAAC